ncbi:hypothetical protein ROR02_25850 [Pararhodospirillum oryzae]|uniref:Uncharacterized protein n=1 Tax=Pararhodospirillum oryzae TaxID=478448 RepID=A0A512HAH5_9PROT|nr:hypothetical protein ROR02_25850 [Pararhodospirillum oryzae]
MGFVPWGIGRKFPVAREKAGENGCRAKVEGERLLSRDRPPVGGRREEAFSGRPEAGLSSPGEKGSLSSRSLFGEIIIFWSEKGGERPQKEGDRVPDPLGSRVSRARWATLVAKAGHRGYGVGPIPPFDPRQRTARE